MTEEEYAKHEQCAHCNNPQHCQGEEECYSLAETKRHFLAGLKAGRPKWHDLRKDPNDLPKESVIEGLSERVIGAVEIAKNQYMSQEC